jgi:hypothetical protein
MRAPIIMPRIKASSAVLVISMFLSGCAVTMLESRAIRDLTPEQIDALAKLRAATGSDLYLCLRVGGPPPTGNTVILAFPKDSKPGVSFSSECQIVSGQSVGIQVVPGPVTIAPLTLVPK